MDSVFPERTTTVNFRSSIETGLPCGSIIFLPHLRNRTLNTPVAAFKFVWYWRGQWLFFLFKQAILVASKAGDWQK